MTFNKIMVAYLTGLCVFCFLGWLHIIQVYKVEITEPSTFDWVYAYTTFTLPIILLFILIAFLINETLNVIILIKLTSFGLVFPFILMGLFGMSDVITGEIFPFTMFYLWTGVILGGATRFSNAKELI